MKIWPIGWMLDIIEWGHTQLSPIPLFAFYGSIVLHSKHSNLLKRRMPLVVFEHFDLNVSINQFCTRYFLDPWHFCCTRNNTHQEQEKYHPLRRNKWTKSVNMRKFWRNPQQMNQPQSTNINVYLRKWSYSKWLFPNCHRKVNENNSSMLFTICSIF